MEQCKDCKMKGNFDTCISCLTKEVIRDKQIKIKGDLK